MLPSMCIAASSFATSLLVDEGRCTLCYRLFIYEANLDHPMYVLMRILFHSHANMQFVCAIHSFSFPYHEECIYAERAHFYKEWSGSSTCLDWARKIPFCPTYEGNVTAGDDQNWWNAGISRWPYRRSKDAMVDKCV